MAASLSAALHADDDTGPNCPQTGQPVTENTICLVPLSYGDIKIPLDHIDTHDENTVSFQMNTKDIPKIGFLLANYVGFFSPQTHTVDPDRIKCPLLHFPANSYSIEKKENHIREMTFHLSTIQRTLLETYRCAVSRRPPVLKLRPSKNIGGDTQIPGLSF